MALTKEKKDTVVADIASMLAGSKLTVVAAYKGTPVKAMQLLRKQARDNGTKVQVVKNRLVIKALQSNDITKETDVSSLTGMLLYAFNSDDEVAPAQVLAQFAKTQPTIQFVGAVTADGAFMSADDVNALAILPSKPQLIAGIISTLNSPVMGVMSGLRSNLHGLLDAIGAKAT